MKYNLKDKIVEGKYSSIYLAKDEENKIVCLKKIISNSKYFDNELDSLIKLNHINCINMLDFHINDDYNYFVLEYCECGTLFQYRDFNRNFLDQIIDGLNYIHSLGIIHRDIKPENILVKNGIPKISDFGFAIKANYISTKILGTLYYISPEIYSNKYYNYKTDIWALGCTFYYVITGNTLFNGDNKKDIIRRIVKHDFRLDVPDEYLNLLSNMLKRNINLRCISYDFQNNTTVNKSHKEVYIWVNNNQYNNIIKNKEYYVLELINVNDILVIQCDELIKIFAVKSSVEELYPFVGNFFNYKCYHVILE